MYKARVVRDKNLQTGQNALSYDRELAIFFMHYNKDMKNRTLPLINLLEMLKPLYYCHGLCILWILSLWHNSLLNIHWIQCLQCEESICFIKVNSIDIWGDSILVSVSVCEADHSGSSPARSVCISQKSGDLPACYQLVHTSADDWFNKDSPCVVIYICDNACKRSLAIYHKSRASCPVSRLLSVPI